MGVRDSSLVFFLEGLVAQLVEHHTFNVGVMGSSPIGVTKKFGTVFA